MNAFASQCQAVVALLVCGVAAGKACAQEAIPEKLKLRATVTQIQDSNYQRAIDSKAMADQINTQAVDVIVALPYGQQRLDLEANLANNKHQTFTQFDYAGHNYNAVWRWSLTPTLVGSLSTRRTETLNSAADSLDPGLRNTNVTRIDNLNAGYLLGGPWQLFADYSKGNSANERALLGVTDISYQSYTAGISYAPSVGNALNYALRNDKGTSTISDYTYIGHALFASYTPTTRTSLKGRLGYIEQRFSVDSKFDFRGVTGGLETNWRLTPKTSISAGWLRDIVSFQTLDSTHAQTDTLSVAPKWQMRPTVSVGWTYKRAVRNGMGSPNGKASTRQDRTEESIWDINWQPRKYLALRTAISNASRISNVIDQDFKTQVLTLSAQFIY